MSLLSRRDFFEDSLLAAAVAAASTGTGGTQLFARESAPESTSPNEKLHGAVIGCHGRGGEHIQQLIHRKDVEIVYVCDADASVGNRRCEEVAKKSGKRMPRFARDLRTLFDDKRLDFVTIATPNHWHSLAAIWAMQAGEHVYVEKPVSHNVSEGRRVVQAAERHKLICQTGTQSRSFLPVQEAIAFLRAGKLGEVKLARGLCYKPRGSIGPRGSYQPPKSVDYNIWSGPARLLPLTRRQFHYDWHWQWPYGNGDLGNQGVHQMDIARWGLGTEQLATTVLGYGGRFGYHDAGETPNTEVSIFEFGPDKTLVFEVRGLKTDELLGTRIGVIFYGSEGYLVCPVYTSPAVFDLKGKLIKSFNGPADLADHFSNFFAAIRAGQPAKLNAPILEGHLSSALCHLGNVSYRLGTTHTNGEAREILKTMKTNEHARETLDRVVAHLSDNDVRLGGPTELRIGPQLRLDPAAERFIGNTQADALLTRDYRAPFVVPSPENV